MLRLTLMLAVLSLVWTPVAAAELVTREVVPSSIDPGVKDFDAPNLAIFDPAAPPSRPLVVFFPGTKGQPKRAAAFLTFIANLGYRVIGLEYDDVPAVQQRCPTAPDPACAGAFRAMRIYGEASAASPVTNPPAEAIVPRLTVLLKDLAKRYPDEGWSGYLEGDAPNWSRIIVTGLSQGAGMAAYIAKRQPVARVVLFSSPWDFSGEEKIPSPWLSTPSATPLDRWYAEYHKRERTSEPLKRAYEKLGILADHLWVFDRDLPPELQTGGENPYHPSTIRDPGYAPQWSAMFGRPD